MSTENAKIKIRNRSLELKWTTQTCDHVMSNYINEHSTHDLTFQEISNLCRRVSFEHAKGRNYEASGTAKGNKYRIFAIVTNKFLVIKTCYRYG